MSVVLSHLVRGTLLQHPELTKTSMLVMRVREEENSGKGKGNDLIK